MLIVGCLFDDGWCCFCWLVVCYIDIGGELVIVLSDYYVRLLCCGVID